MQESFEIMILGFVDIFFLVFVVGIFIGLFLRIVRGFFTPITRF